MTEWRIGMLIEWVDINGELYLERVLQLDRPNSRIRTIDISRDKYGHSARPTCHTLAEVDKAMDSRTARIASFDPYTELNVPEHMIPAAQRIDRDRSWALIEPIVALGDGMFERAVRGPLIAQLSQETGKTKGVFYYHLRRYWQRGMIKNALLPNYVACGAPGQTRQCNPDAPKRGRPRKYDEAVGINVTSDIQAIIREGMSLFYETPLERSLAKAHKFILGRYFNQGFRYEDGVQVPILVPPEERISEKQVRYWYNKLRDPSAAYKARHGTRDYNLDYRPLLGSVSEMATRPGALGTIDWTKLGITLISSLNASLLISQPILALIMDVFTEAITGFYLSHLNACWFVSGQTILVSHADKVEICRQYGVTATSADWPFQNFVYDAILADRGEFAGSGPDHMIDALGIDIANAPPYRPDYKGALEVQFSLTDQDVTHELPGASRGRRVRGDSDPRPSACVTLGELTGLILRRIMHWNRTHRKDWHYLEAAVINDHIDPTPINLWNWGIENLSGAPRTKTIDEMRLNLLPSAQATVTVRGIQFTPPTTANWEWDAGELSYSCRTAIEDQWYQKAREGSWHVTVLWDPRFTDHIYLVHDRKSKAYKSGMRLERCDLVNRQKTYRGRNWYEMVDLHTLNKKAEAAARHEQEQEKVRLIAHTQNVANGAKQRAKSQPASESNSARVRGIPQNTRRERANELGFGQFDPLDLNAFASQPPIPKEAEGPSDDAREYAGGSARLRPDAPENSAPRPLRYIGPNDDMDDLQQWRLAHQGTQAQTEGEVDENSEA